MSCPTIFLNSVIWSIVHLSLENEVELLLGFGFGCFSRKWGALILIIKPILIALGPISIAISCLFVCFLNHLTHHLSCAAATGGEENEHISGVPRIVFYIKLIFNEVCTLDNLCPRKCNRLHFHGIYLKVKCFLWAHFNLFPVVLFWCQDIDVH